jgi:cytochrome P450
MKGLVLLRRVSLNDVIELSCKIDPPQALEAQVNSVLQNPKLLDDAPHRVIYSELLDSEANKGRPPPTASQLSHEARVLFTAGSHTVGTTLMTGVYHILRNPEVQERLVDEVRTTWPVLDQAPSYEVLEKLPYLASAFHCRT